MPSLRHKMPEQSAEKRRSNFSEVALGYTADTAQAEASRCLQCKTSPCRQGCPVEVNIPAFIKHIKDGQMDAAIQEIKHKNNLPAVCGRVCPQENQCEKHCVLAKRGQSVAIGRLERFAADHGQTHDNGAHPALKESLGKVAVIGAGPAGLTAAGDLAGLGYQVTVYEALHAPGGVLIYGIPEFRLPKDIVRKEIDSLKQKGVTIEVNAIAGKTFTIDELISEQGFDAVFIGTGAGLPHFMDIPGENLNGVYSANEFLTRVNLMKAYQFPATATPVHVGKNVAVVGAGNVAMDAARTSLRLGAENVYIVYRRSEDEIPARSEELEHAKEEGIQFHLLTAPVKINGNDKNWVTSLECIRMQLGEPDQSGRRRPLPLEGSNFELPVDTVIMAIGQGPNPLVQQTTPGLAVNKHGNITADEAGFTSKEGVFAGGDIVTGAATVILAMGAGKKAAAAIHDYVQGKKARNHG
ncbi:NADPH-dependent glutamate synthase [Acetonema longum]|uniref:Glutamate synthase (NADPH), homotetrameric n=1 Tax=Acetonema longum DSM 6540 TaxID=1009370 RepID=F7NPA9_9FIRM|nr:NADPH-dependent glutamate synthase [Acetonema longum]EGO62071.1 glutamate synthase (NADPH), homotetrameric [Acetonema longum DSM 6540]